MDNSTGRFISIDPIQDGYNWYAYCEGNPVTYTDPTGLYPAGYETTKPATPVQTPITPVQTPVTPATPVQTPVTPQPTGPGLFDRARDGVNNFIDRLKGSIGPFKKGKSGDDGQESPHIDRSGPTYTTNSSQEAREWAIRESVRQFEAQLYNKQSMKAHNIGNGIELAPDGNDYARYAKSEDDRRVKERHFNDPKVQAYNRSVGNSGRAKKYTTTDTEEDRAIEIEYRKGNLYEWIDKDGNIRWGNVSVKLIFGFVKAGAESTPIIIIWNNGEDIYNRYFNDDPDSAPSLGTEAYVKAQGITQLMQGDTRGFMGAYSPEDVGAIGFYVLEAILTFGAVMGKLGKTGKIADAAGDTTKVANRTGDVMASPLDDLCSKMKSGTSWTIPEGSISFEDLAKLSKNKKKEHLIGLKSNGEYYLAVGSKTQVDVPEDTIGIVVHSHLDGTIGPSPEDLLAIRKRGQDSSLIVAVNINNNKRTGVLSK